MGRLIVVRKRRFSLTLYREGPDGYTKDFSCRCATGAPGFSTPTGPFVIQKKESPPTYTAPNSLWARAAGYRPGDKLGWDDPANPLRGAFLWITDGGVGIHGTPNVLSLGSRASHGCIRVKEEDALYLFEHVEVGTPVVVV